jgi:hypothetical protein
LKTIGRSYLVEEVGYRHSRDKLPVNSKAARHKSAFNWVMLQSISIPEIVLKSVSVAQRKYHRSIAMLY